MKTKCNNCSLVNWQGATECGRCGGKLGAMPAPSLNPFEGGKPGKFNGLRIGFILGVALISAAGAFFLLSPDTPKQVVRSAEQVELEKQYKDAMVNVNMNAVPPLTNMADRIKALKESANSPEARQMRKQWAKEHSKGKGPQF